MRRRTGRLGNPSPFSPGFTRAGWCEEALYIKEVTEEKVEDREIRTTVRTHRDDRAYLDEPYRKQVNGMIQNAYSERNRYEELADIKYINTGGIFDIMAVTVIQHHLSVTGGIHAQAH